MAFEKRVQFSLWYFLLALLAVAWLQGLWSEVRSIEPITYSEFQAHLKEGRIAEVTIGSATVEGRFKEPLPDGRRRFVAVRVEPGLARELDQSGVRYAGAVESRLLETLLSWIVPALVFFGLWAVLMRRFGQGGIGGGFLSIGKSKAKLYVESDIKVTFDDVAGVDEAKEELAEVVGFLKDPDRYSRLGGRVPRGVLLVGPPGTGKTLLARAVAGQAGVAFLSISGSEFVEMFVGVGAARVRDLFEQARAKAPCIIFIDELDALGRARGAYGGLGGHDEKEQTLNQLLAELDGFDPSRGVVLLAATNRPEILDPALLRAGRFDRQILVDRPDKKGRVAILGVHLKRIRCGADVDPQQIAALTPGFSGADLANLVNEAALLATRRGAPAVALADFTGAVERIVAGLERRNRILNPMERKVVAHHEMGHALVALTLPGTDPVHKISIIPRGVGALGYTIQRPTEDRFLMSRTELENKMAVLLGGRAAESIVFGELSTGAADDLAKATDIARGMVMRYGMAEALGQVSYSEERAPYLTVPGLPPAARDFSEKTSCAIDDAVRGLVGAAYERARALLLERRAQLEHGAALLLAKETLLEADLRALAVPAGA
jgi:cell division protease FtsH